MSMNVSKKCSVPADFGFVGKEVKIFVDSMLHLSEYLLGYLYYNYVPHNSYSLLL